MVKTWSFNPRRHVLPYLTSIVVGLGALGGLAGCDHDNELEIKGESPIRLLEFDSREFVIRYTDSHGFPIQGATIECDLQGNSSGAILDTRAAVTDANGEAQFRITSQHPAVFGVRCQAHHSGSAQIRLSVSVSNSNGARLEVRVYPVAAASSEIADVILTENFACVAFDPLRPPAPSSEPIETIVRNVQIVPGGSLVSFTGLRPDRTYTVVAVGKGNGQTITGGCTDQITVTRDNVVRNVPVNAVIQLADFISDIPPGNFLYVTTHYNLVKLPLTAVAGLLRDMSDDPNDPAEYILSRMALYVSEDWLGMRQIILSYRNEIAQILSSSPQVVQGRIQLRKVVKSLESVSDVQLHSTLAFEEPPPGEAPTPGRINATHRFRRFTALIDASPRSFILRDGQRTFNSSVAAALEAPTVLVWPQADRVQIEAHRMTLPIPDHILGTVLMDSFATYRIEDIVPVTVDCSEVGTEVARFLSRDRADLWGQTVEFIARMVISPACNNAVRDVATEVQREFEDSLASAGLDDELLLQGSASLQLASDGVTIEELKAGSWAGVGSFSAKR